LELPQWAKDWDAAYDFEAKSARAVNTDECRAMVRGLLADRFKMSAHREMRELRAFALTVGKSGPKLHEAGEGVKINRAKFQSLSDAEPPKGLSMERLAAILTNHPVLGARVVDRTKLNGEYCLELLFSMQDGDGRPSIFTAVQEQLGLKLEATKAPVEVLVIDHLERASVN